MREGALAERELPDGRYITLYPLLFNRFRILVSEDATTQGSMDSW